jgi:hypothetical protein
MALYRSCAYAGFLSGFRGGNRSISNLLLELPYQVRIQSPAFDDLAVGNAEDTDRLWTSALVASIDMKLSLICTYTLVTMLQ